MAGAVVETTLAVAAGIANMAATNMQINEGISDYSAEIGRMKEMRNARLTQMTGAEARAKEIGIAGLEEQAKAGEYETRTAMMKAEMTSSSAQARMGASGVKATGSALMGAQQATDIAYAAADRTAEAAASGINIGGLQLGNQLQTAEGQKSLLTLEYRQDIEQQERKKKDLQKNRAGMLAISAAGGALNAASTYYNATARDRVV
jgi:hypothetical protein